MASSTRKFRTGGPSASRSRVFGASTQFSNSRSRVGMSTAGVGSSNSARVFLEGLDVTPMSLLVGKGRAVNTDKTSDASQTSSSKSIISDINTASQANILSNPASPRGIDGGGNLSDLGGMNKRMSGLISTRLASKKSKLQEENSFSLMPKRAPEVDGPITIKLEETATIFLFELPSVCVAQDSNEHPVVAARNKVYEKICDSKNGNDCFIQSNTQTLNFAQKNKEVMAAPPASRDAGCMASVWDIYDQGEDLDGGGNDADDAGGLETAKVEGSKRDGSKDTVLMRKVDQHVEACLASPGCLLEVDGDIVKSLSVRASMNRRKKKQKDRGRRRGGINDSNSNYGDSRAFGQSNTQASSSRQNIHASSGDVNNSSSSIGNSTTDVMDVSQSSGQGTQGSYDTSVDVRLIMAQREVSAILNSQTLLKHLDTMDRAVQQNIFHERHLLYRDFPILDEIKLEGSAQEQIQGTDTEEQQGGITSRSVNHHHTEPSNESSTPSSQERNDDLADIKLAYLWGFQCPLTNGRTVTCMVWNKVNEDLLAVSYGQFDFRHQTGGLVLLWSLKNPKYPERVYKMSDGVTSIDFSTAHPNLLAVGQYNGIVAIYDTRKEDETPILESGQSSGTHMDAVWQVKWVHKGSERGESLVSISSDGRVTEWSMKKGLTFTDLMLLKRVANQHTGSKTISEGIISRQASGHCIDFGSKDSSVYFAGTEDGIIHKCSCSYNEQYLESYFGHSGPVYSLRISPFWDQVFLSCSSDWTVKLWNQNDSQEVLSFHSMDLAHAVHDVAWSPTYSTVFGSVTEDGRIELWDLHQSTLDPIITHFPKHIPQDEQSELSTTSTGMGAESGGGMGTRDGDNEVGIHDHESQFSEADHPETEGVSQQRSQRTKDASALEEKVLQCTSLLFAPSAPVLVVGDSHGVVTVYRLPSFKKESKHAQFDALKQTERLKKAMYPDSSHSTLE